ncbi:single-stranded DNA-binding protein [Neolewinella aurantiaca]|uniref:Single-stranded DNA-binding protein n=1 Tax=Neolewinella aurantiaca TaxID=2602767 RepID=A0A5C7FTI7_9BACT|nr:single-stranded DNA-binding protein [Neolewinella aurantiaca]TXF88136.1 single-stranded DNA-binding protein [Neolewinella aurantiaca]
MPNPHNQIQLTGRAGHSPEVFTMTDGTMMARLRLYQSATNRSGERSSTAFSIVAWGSMAESLHRKVRRGDNLFVTGQLRIRTWKQEGINHVRPEIHLGSYLLLQRVSNPGHALLEETGSEPGVAPPE